MIDVQLRFEADNGRFHMLDLRQPTKAGRAKVDRLMRMYPGFMEEFSHLPAHLRDAWDAQLAEDRAFFWK